MRTRIMLVAAATLCAVTLAACGGGPTTEEQARLKTTLPDGCKFYEVGSYGSIEDLVFIQCEAAPVTSTAFRWSVQQGKVRSSRFGTSFVIGAPS